jgi:hypothetical protein
VGDLVVEPTADGQWQGLFLTLDVNPEPIVIEGCEGGCNDSGGLDLDLESALGCDDTSTGCEGCGGDGGEGCDAGGGSCSATGRGASRVFLIVFAFVFVGLRRRRS